MDVFVSARDEHSGGSGVDAVGFSFYYQLQNVPGALFCICKLQNIKTIGRCCFPFLPSYHTHVGQDNARLGTDLHKCTLYGHGTLLVIRICDASNHFVGI